VGVRAALTGINCPGLVRTDHTIPIGIGTARHIGFKYFFCLTF
jgi:hypothetical protein